LSTEPPAASSLYQPFSQRKGDIKFDLRNSQFLFVPQRRQRIDFRGAMRGNETSDESYYCK
jgi:hypothetical protein